MAKLFEQVLKESSSRSQKDAVDWLRQTALKTTKIKPETIIDDATSFKRIQSLSENSIGKMYFFNYDPKLKEVLPYYDQYPLVFPIEYYKDSFLGINLHYLPPMLRAQLMDALTSVINNKKYDKTTQLTISYRILSGAAKFKYFKPCLKKYLFSHVKSPFIYISPVEWNFALMLPVESFVGASKSTVYRDSQAMVG